MFRKKGLSWWEVYDHAKAGGDGVHRHTPTPHTIGTKIKRMNADKKVTSKTLEDDEGSYK